MNNTQNKKLLEPITIPLAPAQGRLSGNNTKLHSRENCLQWAGPSLYGCRRGEKGSFSGI